MIRKYKILACLPLILVLTSKFPFFNNEKGGSSIEAINIQRIQFSKNPASKLNSSEPRVVNFRNNLENSLSQFKNKQQGRVAFLGGSITHNPGWREMVMEYLRNRFASTKFHFINAGIPSMGSVPGAFRLQKDVLAKGKIDLLFVEAAVNDATNGRAQEAMLRGMEGIVRHARKANPFTDIIMMHFADPGKLADYKNGKIPQVIQQHEQVAEHYQVTSINLAKEVYNRINLEEFTWEDDFKNLHPSPFGQQLYFNTIKWVFKSSWNNKSSLSYQKHALPDEPLDRFSYANGYFKDITKAEILNNWEIIKSWHPGDTAGTREGFVNVPVLEANQPDASLSLKFNGSAIGILVTTGPDAGKISYSIDGSGFKTLDQYTKWSHMLHLPWLYILADELDHGSHQLILKIAETKNEKSQGNFCRIHRFAVNPG